MVRPSAEPRAAFSAERIQPERGVAPAVGAVTGEQDQAPHTGGLFPRHEVVHRTGHGRGHHVGGGDAPQDLVPAVLGVEPVERGPTGTGGGADGRVAQPQPGGHPPAGVARRAEDKSDVVAHDRESTARTRTVP